jgi:hypothetical protein
MATTTTKKKSNSQVKSSLTIAKNTLRNYASYSPIISLYAATPKNYSTMMKSGKWDATLWNLICKSGGIGTANTSTYFNRDLFIDNVEMTTIAGMSSANRGSNVTDISFTINEPNGMDLIENLHDFCINGINEHNYCQIPYLLKMEFAGYTDNGTYSAIGGSTKYIPIHLINMTVKLNQMGSVYKVEAIAFNEVVTTEQHGRIPATIELSNADNLTNDVISNSTANTTTSSSSTTAASNTSMSKQDAQKVVSDAQKSGTAGVIDIGSNTSLSDIMNKFAECLNNFQVTLEQDQSGYVPDTYIISFEGDTSNTISKSKISGQAADAVNAPVAKDTVMSDPIASKDGYDVKKASAWYTQFVSNAASASAPTGGVEYASGKISFNSGSSIIDAMNTLIINSTYITDQIKDYNQKVAALQTGNTTSTANLAELNSTPLNWFMITPKVSMSGTYDYIRKTYAKDITYVINPYTVYNSASISISNGSPADRIVKEYDYIFTGKNTEILAFDIDFQTAFLTYAQYTGNVKTLATGGKVPNDTGAKLATMKVKSSPINQGMSTSFVANNNKNTTGVGSVTPEMAQSSDVAATIYSVADLLQLNLTIIGDPDYIKQDGLFAPHYYKGAISNTASPYFSYNTGEIYATINFKLPHDENLNTGMMTVNYKSSTKEYKRSVFSGNYRIVTIKNKFNKGNFTQELEMYRYTDSHEFESAG